MRKVAALVLALAATPALAHEWYMGQRNERGQNCCSTLDCAPLPAGTRVVYTGDGYDVTIIPGTHPMVNAEDVTAPWGSYGAVTTRRGVGSDPVVFHFEGNPGLSPDGNIHACIMPADVPQRRIRCLFLGGSV